MLLHSSDSCVRAEVAKYGYCLTTLVNDKNSYVRSIANKKLEELRNKLEEDYNNYDVSIKSYDYYNLI